MVIGLCTWIISDKASEKKICYVNNRQLFDQFSLKKELESELKVSQGKYRQQLDTLQIRMNVVLESDNYTGQQKQQVLAEMRQEYARKEDEFSRQEEKLQENFEEHIWTQLNQYIADYGKEHHCLFILGGNGDGNLMYVDESLDITREVQEYVNARYKDIKGGSHAAH